MIQGIDTSYLVAAELASHPRHAASFDLLERLDHDGNELALAPQVLAEFVHVVTDSRRISVPLNVATALERAELIWNRTLVLQVFPDATAKRT